MAKQSGLHQIRGKVGDFSYYKQSGVSAGIIRGINQGMSSRVKTGDEYANTRRNNKEFANACEIAASFGACVVPKWRPMFLTFSQAAIAKAVLSFIKEDDTTGTTWGTRSLRESDFASALESLNNRAKNPFSNQIIDMQVIQDSDPSAGKGQITLNATLSQNILNYWDSIGCSGANWYLQLTYVTVGKRSPLGVVAKSRYYRVAADGSSIDEGQPTFTTSLEYSKRLAPASTAGYQKLVVALVVVPTREINGEVIEMQEFATFQAVAHDEA